MLTALTRVALVEHDAKCPEIEHLLMLSSSVSDFGSQLKKSKGESFICYEV